MLLNKLQIHRAFPAIFATAVLFSSTVVTFAAPHSTDAAKSDPVLRAMKAELDREQAQLVLPGLPRPYFIEYRIDDFTTFEALADYGALLRDEDQHNRILRVTVRVGNYQSDSSSARGDGSIALAPTDDDSRAIRYSLWAATDQAYKNALRVLASKQAAMKRFENTAGENDFATAKPIVHIDPLVALHIDRGEWKRRIVQASGLYTSDPEVSADSANVQFSTATVRGVAVNRYLVNTEGTMLRHGYAGYSALVSVGGQASDGMQLSRINSTTAVAASDLESWPIFRKHTIDSLQSLEALRKAPVVASDDYHGPVLFSASAAADIFNSLFIPNVEANRPEMGTTARTLGAYSSSLHERVLPDFLSVTDDPLTTSFAGQALLGAYTIDDEGVPAQAVNVVVDGKLQNFLIGRTPIREFPESNGHGRAALAQAAHPQPGVMIFKSSEPLSAANMNDRLLAMAKDQKQDVYVVDAMGAELTPRLLYLVHPDGTRQLVRGAVLDELDNRSLRSDIIAAGSDPYVDNELAGVPFTTIAPSLLFDEIGVKRAPIEQHKLPYYAPPPPAAR